MEVRLKSIALKISNKVKISTIAVAQTTRKSFFAIRKNHCSFFRVLLLLVKTYNALIGVRVLYIYMLFTRWEVWRENYFPEVSKKARGRRLRDIFETEGKYFSIRANLNGK